MLEGSVAEPAAEGYQISKPSVFSSANTWLNECKF